MYRMIVHFKQSLHLGPQHGCAKPNSHFAPTMMD